MSKHKVKSMNTISSYFILLFTLLFLSACSSVDIKQYENNQPKLILDQFFNGDLTAHGILKNRRGEVTRYFNVTMTGTWDTALPPCHPPDHPPSNRPPETREKGLEISYLTR